jgi:hypothetical protein
MTASVSLSFIVPTCGRSSLYATLVSIEKNGSAPTDQVIVVADGPQPEAQFITHALRLRLPHLIYHEHAKVLVHGGPLRNWAMPHATGTHLCFMDDDDTYGLGAILRIRERVEKEPDRILMFKMRGLAKRLLYDTLWRTPELYQGNIGTPMFIVPNVKEKLGRWGDAYCGDFEFIKTTVDKFGADRVSWIDDVVAEIR